LLEAAEILYRNTKAEELRSFQSLESSTNQGSRASKSKLLFFIRQITGTDKGEKRVKSVVGKVTLMRQAKILGLKPYSQLSPLFEKTACY